MLQKPADGWRAPPNSKEDYRIDFGLDDVEAWGEFDGTGKYFDPAMRATDAGDRDEFLREKAREDWIRGRSADPSHAGACRTSPRRRPSGAGSCRST